MPGLFHRFVFRTTVVFLLLMSGQAFGQESLASDKSAPPSSEEAQKPASQGTAAPAPSPAPRLPIHIVPYGSPATPPKTSKPGGRSSNTGQVQYWGGPVISQVQPVVVIWGSFVDSGSTGQIQQFFTDVLTTDYFDLLAEYSTVGITGVAGGSSNQTIDNVVFTSPKFFIVPSVCQGGAAAPACSVDDSKIQTELLAQINAGHLPQPVQDGQGNFDTIYMIYFPPGVTITAGGVASCQQFGFCAYHSNVFPGSPAVPYGVFPDFSSGGCAPQFHGCGGGTAFQNLTSASSHELGEAVTDVDVGTATAFAPPLGWADKNSGQEIGDFCNQNDAQITVNGTTYTVQTQMSNMQGGCVSAPGHFTVNLSTNNAVPGTPFQVTVIPEGFFGTLFGYNNTVQFTSSDGAASLPADYTFVPNTDNGSHTFNVTMNTTGQQTLTVTDTLIKRMTGVSPSVDIEHNPDLTVSLSHSGSFKQGDTADTYTMVVMNSGDRPTNTNLVTASISLPFGLALTSLSGTGWNCPSGNLSCTRADALAAGNPYPPITVTVSVVFNAPGMVTPVAQVSGGGEQNTSNDQASDPTTIIQFADMVVFSGHNGAFSQGQIGATYTLTAQNTGFVASSGLVTVTDTLPSGLTATAMSGTGWSCTVGTVSCTRSDALASFSSYPVITLTVNVDPAAGGNPPSPLTNTVSISGGGEVNTTNDSNADVTQIILPAPDLVIVKSHNGNFTQGQTGATYTLTVSNIGPAATTGQVTVSDNLPFDMTATAIGGTGWSCQPLPQLNCARSDALAGFTASSPPSYPPITLTVNVSPGAGPSDMNFAFVSGGGEVNTGNDNAQDPTNIIQLPNLTVNQSLTTQLAQGLTGVNYSINVSNSSFNAATSGTVMATGQLSSGLTATAISGQGWSCTLGTLTCTRSDSLAAFSFYPSIIVTFNVAANAPSSVTFTATVSGGGEVITSDDSQTLQTQVAPPISITGFTTSQTVKAGSSASFQIGVNAVIPGSVTVTCSGGVPPGATCSPFPSSFTAPFNSTISVTVTTTGATPSAFASAHPQGGRQGRGIGGAGGLTPLATALMACLGCVVMLPLRNSRAVKSRRWAMLAVFCVLLIALLAPGCGGGGGGGGGKQTVVTPPGTYNITVTVNNTTANNSANIPLTLTVQ